MEVANTLAYYNKATITAVKIFIAQAPVGKSNDLVDLGYKTFYNRNCRRRLQTETIMTKGLPLPSLQFYIELAGSTRRCPGHYIKIIKCIVRAKVARKVSPKVLHLLFNKLCLKMTDHGSRSTWGPGPSRLSDLIIFYFIH